MNKHTPSKGMVAAAKRGVEMSKTPELSNNDLPTNSVQGGKKIASGQQISDDHVRAMADYHAAHMGACPAGDDAEGCDDLLWGGQAGAGWAASRVAAMDATSLSADTGPDVDTMLAGDGAYSIELYTRPDLVLEGKTDLQRGEDGLIWAPILRSGTLACTPDPTSPNGRKNEPLTFVSGRAASPKEIGLEDIVDAFNDNAIQHVTIPKTHRNNEFENTGFIRKLKIADSTMRPGEKVILAGHEFLDADAESRVESGLIANRSCGILHGYQNTETGKTYPHALEHVALTNKPWVTGMESYGSDIFTDGRSTVSLMMSDGLALPAPESDPEKLPPIDFSTSTPLENLTRELQLADILWDDQDGEPSLNAIRNGLYQALDTMGSSPYFDEGNVYFNVRDVRPTQALVSIDYGGSDPEDAVVIPFSWTDGKLVLGDFAQWKWTHQAYVSDDDANQDKEEVQQLMQSDTSLSLADAEAIFATYLDVPAFLRNKAKKGGDTLPDGSYPITTQKQANSAWKLRNNGKAPAATVVAHIKKQVAKYKLEMPTDKAPAKTNASLPTDPLKRASMLRLSQEPTPAIPGGIMTLTPEELASLNLDDSARTMLGQKNAEDQRRDAELAKFRKQAKETNTATRLSRAKEIFGESNTGVLAEINALLMADDDDVVTKLNLADDAGVVKETHLTMGQVIDRLFAAIPKPGKDAAATALSLKTNLLENPLSARPDLNPDPADIQDGATQLSADQLLASWGKVLPNGIDLNIARQPVITTTQA